MTAEDAELAEKNLFTAKDAKHFRKVREEVVLAHFANPLRPLRFKILVFSATSAVQDFDLVSQNPHPVAKNATRVGQPEEILELLFSADSAIAAVEDFDFVFLATDHWQLVFRPLGTDH